MRTIVRLAGRSLIAIMMVAGLVASLPATATAIEPPDNSHATPGGGTNKFGYVPGLGEYRVHSAITLDLGPGVVGGVERTEHFVCVNANGEFPFRTTSPVPETHDLWMDVSVSVLPPCFQSKSYAEFRVYVTSPYSGFLWIYLREQQDGKFGQSPFELVCSDGQTSHLDCRQPSTLHVVITCRDEALSRCPDRESRLPFPLPDLGSTG